MNKPIGSLEGDGSDEETYFNANKQWEDFEERIGDVKPEIDAVCEVAEDIFEKLRGGIEENPDDFEFIFGFGGEDYRAKLDFLANEVMRIKVAKNFEQEERDPVGTAGEEIEISRGDGKNEYDYSFEVYEWVDGKRELRSGLRTITLGGAVVENVDDGVKRLVALGEAFKGRLKQIKENPDKAYAIY